MAKNLRTILGAKLLTRPLTSEPLKDLPSPEVQHTAGTPTPPSPKCLLSSLIFQTTLVPGAEGSHPDKGEEAHSSPGSAGKERQLRQLLLQLRRRSGERRQEHAQKGAREGRWRRRRRRALRGFEIRHQFPPPRPSQVSPKLSPELSELVVYCRSVPFPGFENLSENPPNEMSSFSESEALRLIKDSGANVGIMAAAAAAAADSARLFAISLRWITACASLSFHSQGSSSRDTTADS